MKKIILASIMFITISGVAMAQDDATINKTGDKAPVFTCTTIDGKIIDINELKGKVIMINFFATWCGPCNAELPVLQKEVWEKYKNNPDFVLVVLGREHTDEEIQKFAEKKGLNLPFASDKKREIFNLYAKQNIPRNVLIGKDGKIILQNTGYTAEDFKKLTDLLAEELK